MDFLRSNPGFVLVSCICIWPAVLSTVAFVIGRRWERFGPPRVSWRKNDTREGL